MSTKLDRWSFAEVCTLLNAILVLSVQTVFLIVFSHLVIIPILLMIIDQEKNSVHTLWILLCGYMKQFCGEFKILNTVHCMRMYYGIV